MPEQSVQFPQDSDHEHEKRPLYNSLSYNEPDQEQEHSSSSTKDEQAPPGFEKLMNTLPLRHLRSSSYRRRAWSSSVGTVWSLGYDTESPTQRSADVPISPAIRRILNGPDHDLDLSSQRIHDQRNEDRHDPDTAPRE